jgi:hypothetical protein
LPLADPPQALGQAGCWSHSHDLHPRLLLAAPPLANVFARLPPEDSGSLLCLPLPLRQEGRLLAEIAVHADIEDTLGTPDRPCAAWTQPPSCCRFLRISTPGPYLTGTHKAGANLGLRTLRRGPDWNSPRSRTHPERSPSRRRLDGKPRLAPARDFGPSAPPAPTSKRSARRLCGTLPMGVSGQRGGPPSVRPRTLDSELREGQLERGRLARRNAVMACYHAFSPSRRVGIPMLCRLAVVPAELAIGNSSQALEKFRRIFGAAVGSGLAGCLRGNPIPFRVVSGLVQKLGGSSALAFSLGSRRKGNENPGIISGQRPHRRRLSVLNRSRKTGSHECSRFVRGISRDTSGRTGDEAWSPGGDRQHTRSQGKWSYPQDAADLEGGSEAA